MVNLVFSFGTLQQADVQQSLFGRTVSITADTVVGYRVGRVRITDPGAIEASGSDVHPALLVTEDPRDVLEGSVLELSDAELAAVDAYEAGLFRRVDVVTQGGRRALAYAPKVGLPILG